ncbi:MAG TPA: hypothetical protein VMG36_02005, partial [Thermoplasmata archaeon]|nr:hypothetical protein [Thermoplasmata archaeon]
TEIDAGTDAVVGSISVPNDPTLVAIDNDTGTVYVAESSGNITAITAANLTDVGPIPVSYVTGFAWDPSAGGVLAFNETGSVALLNGSSLGATDFAVGVATASGGWAPGAGLLVADAATGDLLLVGTPGLELATNFTLRVAPEIGGVGDEFTVSWTFSGNLEPTGFGWGASGNVSFSASSSSPDGPLDVELTGAGVLSLHVSVEFANGQVLSGQLTFAAVPSTLVSFDESGLGPDGAWYVAIAEGPYVTGAPGTIDLPLANGVYAFQVGTFSAGYLVAPAFGVVRVNGTAVSIVEEFEPVFLVTATASGLAAGTNWSLVVGGVVHSSTSPAITFLAGNGSYAYRLGLVSGYAAANGSGTFGVAGEPVELSFAFHRVTYLVTFSESGLIPGTVWWLYAGWLSDPYWSTANASVAFSLPNGTYDYFFYSAAGYRLTQSNALLVVDGSAVNVSATYTPYPDSIFSVAFDESGLPNGSTWSVDFAGRSATSNGSEISFLSFNGTWSYAIGNVAGHVASPASGTVTVNGAAANVSVIYAPTLYSITFAEFGRPLDRPWTVSLAGALQFTGNDQVTFQVPNGSYPFRVTGPPGYRAEGVGGVGTITVDGASQLLAVDFVRAPTAEISFTRAGLAPHSVWCVAMVDVSTCATTSAIHFPGLTPGDYAYAVLSPTAGQTVTAHLGAEAVATSGTIDLGARSVTVAFKFAYQYFVTFAASGLPAGTDWSVRFEGTLRATNGSAIVFLASNGSSSFRLFAPAGYRAVATPGRVRVEGSAVVVNVAFHPIGHPATPESSTSAPVRAPEMRRAPDVALTRWRS